jgi:AraC-like DNA-binding protein
MEEQKKQFALSLIAYAAQRDISTEELCKNANIDLASIKRSQEYVLSKKQLDDLWLYAGRLSNDPLFGLHFGESLQLSALGVVGEIIKSSRTVGEAIGIGASLTHLITDLFRMKVTHAGKTFIIQLIPSEQSGSSLTMRHMTDLLMVFIVHELDGLLLEKIRPFAVYYPYAVPDVAEYERVLRCKPLKKKDRFAIHFKGKYWEEPIISANYELQNFLLQKVNASVSNESSGALTQRVHHYLMSHAYLGILSLEDVAANFNITPRSLQRRLQEEGKTFQQLSDSVKKSLALHYITLGKHQMKEISNILGYNELSAFSRAFKRWTGKAPANYLR